MTNYAKLAAGARRLADKYNKEGKYKLAHYWHLRWQKYFALAGQQRARR